jgi:hypothetical protein
MRIGDFTFGTTTPGEKAGSSGNRGGTPNGIRVLAGLGLIAAAACIFTGCPTGPGSTTNTTPAAPSWSILDQTTGGSQNNLVPAGSSITVFINPGDNYMATFLASSASGIKSITLSGSGSVICHNNAAPFSEASPFKYTIPAQPIVFAPQPGGQFFTAASDPFLFTWALSPKEAAGNAPASSALSGCRDQVPLLGTTTYTGQATTEANVTSAASSLLVTTCAAGLVTSPSITCP